MLFVVKRGSCFDTVSKQTNAYLNGQAQTPNRHQGQSQWRLQYPWQSPPPFVSHSTSAQRSHRSQHSCCQTNTSYYVARNDIRDAQLVPVSSASFPQIAGRIAPFSRSKACCIAVRGLSSHQRWSCGCRSLRFLQHEASARKYQDRIDRIDRIDRMMRIENTKKYLFYPEYLVNPVEKWTRKSCSMIFFDLHDRLHGLNLSTQQTYTPRAGRLKRSIFIDLRWIVSWKVQYWWKRTWGRNHGCFERNMRWKIPHDLKNRD